MSATAHTGQPIRGHVHIPGPDDVFKQFLSLAWYDRDHKKEYSRNIDVFLDLGQVEFLHEKLGEAMKEMREAKALE